MGKRLSLLTLSRPTLRAVELRKRWYLKLGFQIRYVASVVAQYDLHPRTLVLWLSFFCLPTFVLVILSYAVNAATAAILRSRSASSLTFGRSAASPRTVTQSEVALWISRHPEGKASEHSELIREKGFFVLLKRFWPRSERGMTSGANTLRLTSKALPRP